MLRKLARALAAAALLAAALSATPTFADSAVSCVQEQLTALGYDPGPVDGQFGRKTATAFGDLVQASPDAFTGMDSPTLSALNADTWCPALAEAFAGAAPAHQTYAPLIAEELGGFKYDIGPDVPAAQLAVIRRGLVIARAYIAKTFGEEIPEKIRTRMTVKIVATGRGNEEPWGGGAAATAFTDSLYPRPFFDVAHQEWDQDTRGRGWTRETDNMKTVVHEYVHDWQMVLGALSLRRQELGNWMNEGIAEYIAYQAMVDAGLMKWSDITRFMAAAPRGPQLDNPLSVFGTTNTPAWAGHIGFLAIDWLVAESPEGIMALKTIAQEVLAGRSQREAFANAFGLELDDFYSQFEPYREALRKNPSRAYANRPTLVFPAAIDKPGAASAEPAAPSPEQAERWYQEAMSFDGKGDDQDREAVRLYRLAADAGHPAAARNLGGMLSGGRGVDKKDQAEATRLFRFAAEAGDAQGQYGLAVWFLDKSAKDERISWLRKAAAQGHENAIAELDKMGVPREDPAPKTAAVEVPAEADPLAAAKCVQAGLNAAGYPAGSVDGQIGNGTLAAFKSYAASLNLPITAVPLAKPTQVMWCLHIGWNTKLDGEAARLLAQVEAGAEAYINLAIPEEVPFRIVLMAGDSEIATNRDPEWTTIQGRGVHRAAFNIADVRKTDTVCTHFEDGWVVLDKAGQGYQASCDPVSPAAMTLDGLINTYTVEKR